MRTNKKNINKVKCCLFIHCQTYALIFLAMLPLLANKPRGGLETCKKTALFFCTLGFKNFFGNCCFQIQNGRFGKSSVRCADSK